LRPTRLSERILSLSLDRGTCQLQGTVRYPSQLVLFPFPVSLPRSDSLARFAVRGRALFLTRVKPPSIHPARCTRFRCRVSSARDSSERFRGSLRPFCFNPSLVSFFSPFGKFRSNRSAIVKRKMAINQCRLTFASARGRVSLMSLISWEIIIFPCV